MRSWTQRNLLIWLGAACLLLVGDSAAQQASPYADGQAPASAMVAATVPRLIRFSGVASASPRVQSWFTQSPGRVSSSPPQTLPLALRLMKRS